jgi:hypothetical protein
MYTSQVAHTRLVVNSFVFLVLRNSERVLGYQITELRVLGRTTE